MEWKTRTEITWSSTEKKQRKASNKRTSKPRSYHYFVNTKESAKQARRPGRHVGGQGIRHFPRGILSRHPTAHWSDLREGNGRCSDCYTGSSDIRGLYCQHTKFNFWMRSPNCEKDSYIYYVCLSVLLYFRPYRTSGLQLDVVKCNLIFVYFSKICPENSRFIKI